MNFALFKFGDRVAWKTRDPKLIRDYGEGPFTVLSISLKTECRCGGGPSSRKHSDECPVNISPVHPQLITIVSGRASIRGDEFELAPSDEASVPAA